MNSIYNLFVNVPTIAERRTVCVAACFYQFVQSTGVAPAGQRPPALGTHAETFRPRAGDDRSVPCTAEQLAILARTEGLEEQYFWHLQRNSALAAFVSRNRHYPVWVADGANDIGRRARSWHSDAVLAITEQPHREGCGKTSCSWSSRATA